MPIRIIVIDDHPLFRDGVVHVLAAEPDMAVVAQGGTAAEAVRLTEELRPDIVLLDIAMPGGGLEAAREIGRGDPATRVVMLTVSEDEQDLRAALQAGARAYVLKGVAADELCALLRRVHEGHGYVAPALAARVLGSRRAVDPTAPLKTLNARERAILQLIGRGWRNREIADELGLSHTTVKQYVSAVLRKLSVRSRLEAALVAQHCGSASAAGDVSAGRGGA